MTPVLDFQRVFEALPVPALVVDHDGRIVGVNGRFLDLSGRPAADLLEHPIERLLEPEPDPTDARRIRQAVQRALEVGEPDAVAAIRSPQGYVADGLGPRFWSVSTAPVPRQHDDPVMAIVRIEDVTEALLEASNDRPAHPLRRRSDAPQGAVLVRARHLQDLSRMLEQQSTNDGTATEATPGDDAVDRFLASLAHELRNPLAAIRGALDVLSGDPTAESEALLGVIDRQIQALTRITDDVLEVTRARVGKMTIEPRRLELGALAASAVESLRASGVLTDQAVELSIRGRLWVIADPVRLTQALNNLLGNAVKFTDAQGTIRVTVEREGAAAKITLTDDGIGFAPDHAALLFEPFAQEAEQPGARAGGLGLGLAIAKTIVELHGGDITATSAGIGRGATFAVRIPLEAGGGGHEFLPAATVTAPAPEPAAVAEPAPVSAAVAEPAPVEAPSDSGAFEPERNHRGSYETAEALDFEASVALGEDDPVEEETEPLNVLVIEDSEDVAAAFRAQLERLGHRVDVAGSAAVGIHKALRAPWNVVLCDIGLPDLSGYEVVHYLRTEHPGARLPVIAITGYGREADRSRALAAGFDDFLVKPVAARDLVEAVETAARGLIEPRR